MPKEKISALLVYSVSLQVNSGAEYIGVPVLVIAQSFVNTLPTPKSVILDKKFNYL